MDCKWATEKCCSPADHVDRVTVNRISVVNLERMLISQNSQDFNEVDLEENTEMSIEFKRILKMASKALLKDGHYSLKLLFRNSDVLMPNNLQVVEQRMQSLKKKMKRDEQLKQDCVCTG